MCCERLLEEVKHCLHYPNVNKEWPFTTHVSYIKPTESVQMVSTLPDSPISIYPKSRHNAPCLCNNPRYIQPTILPHLPPLSSPPPPPQPHIHRPHKPPPNNKRQTTHILKQPENHQEEPPHPTTIPRDPQPKSPRRLRVR